MRITLATGILAALLPLSARPQYAQDFGDVTVNYSAIATDRLLPEMAKRYGIVRSRERALVNIAVQRKGADGNTVPVPATISGFGVSLGGQRVDIAFREIVENDTISYIGEIPVSAPDTYRFTVSIVPERTSTPYTVNFSQDFVAD